MLTLPELQFLFKQYAQQQTFTHSPKELYEPIEYILSLGGKAMRPALALMACNLYQYDIRAALPVAYCVELFHNFSLMHDDIMDKSPLRRGQPTVHIKYNTNTAILSGDAMLVLAYQYLENVEPAVLPNVLKIFTRTSIGVCEGQQMDMNFETLSAKEVSIEQYLRMIELKTAVLLQGALEMGALVGGADSAQAQLLGEFGRDMGIAFQLKDDYLDTFGESAKVGKRIGGDILQNKKTYLILKALEVAPTYGTAEKEQELLHWLTTQTTTPEAEIEKIQAVTHLLYVFQIPDYTLELIETYYQRALEHLDKLDIAPEKTNTLRLFIRQIMDREH